MDGDITRLEQSGITRREFLQSLVALAARGIAHRSLLRTTIIPRVAPAGLISGGVLASQAAAPDSAAASHVTYLFRDTFPVDAEAPLSNSAICVPGPGQWTVTDTKAVLFRQDGRLRGGAQPGIPAWGPSRVVGSAIPRSAGRAFVALFTPEDFSNAFFMGWQSDPNASDPRLSGHGWLCEDGQLQTVTATGAITHAGGVREIRSMQYLVAVVLGERGAYVCLSTFGNDTGHGRTDPLPIPPFPSARLIWHDYSGTASQLYPVISYFNAVAHYPNGHAVEDVRVFDFPSPWSTPAGIAAVADPLASAAPIVADNFTLVEGPPATPTVSDNFNRPNSTATLGGSWAVDFGTWGIANNRAYNVAVSGPLTSTAWTNAGLADGIFEWDVTTPPSGTVYWSVVLRRQDPNNYIRVTNYATTSTVYVQRCVNGIFSTIPGAGGSFATTNNATFRVTVIAKANQYRVLINGAVIIDWRADASESFLTAQGAGFQVIRHFASGQSYDNIVVRPVSFQTLGDGWSTDYGVWGITESRAHCVLVSGPVNSAAWIDTGLADGIFECDVTTPTSGVVYWSLIVRRQNADNYLRITNYATADKVYIQRCVNGFISTLPSGVGAFTTDNGRTYHVVVMTSGNRYRVLIDDVVIIDWKADASNSFLTATGAGFQCINRFTANQFYDNFTARPILGPVWSTDYGLWSMGADGAYCYNVSGPVTSTAWTNAGLADGIFEWDVTTPPSGTVYWSVVLRRQDPNNYIRVTNYATTSVVYVQRCVNGITTTMPGGGGPYTTTHNSTFHVTVLTKGNLYRVYINNQLIINWFEDTSNSFLTATRMGVQVFNGLSANHRYSNVVALPHMVTLPSGVAEGAIPTIITGQTTIASDTFTDTNGKAIIAHTPQLGGPWSVIAGTWVINNGRATCTVAEPDVTNHIIQTTSSADVECEVDIIMPDSFPTDWISAGIMVRWVNPTHHIMAHIYHSPLQPFSDEIELIERNGGDPHVVHKSNLGDSIHPGKTYRLRVQVRGRFLQIFINNEPRISYYLALELNSTKHGIYRQSYDNGCTFDNWRVRTL